MIALTLAAAPLQQSAIGTAERPVHAEVDVSAGRTHVLVVGRSPRSVDVRYELVLRNGGNQTTQSGSETLAPGRRAVLFDVVQSGNEVRGNLTVHIGSTTYQQQITGATETMDSP